MRFTQFLAAAAVLVTSFGALAQTVPLAPGQSTLVRTDATRPALTLTVPSSGGGTRFYFLPGTRFDGVDPNRIDGYQGFLNTGALKVLPTDGARLLQYDVEDEFGDVLVFKTEVRSTWKESATLDVVTGLPVALSGISAYTVSSTRRISGWVTGGALAYSRHRLDTQSQSIQSDVMGQRYATSTKPAFNFSRQATPTWMFDRIDGPALPVAQLQSAATVQERLAILKNAGYSATLNATGGLRVIGVYRTVNLRFTEQGKADLRDALGFLSTPMNGLTAGNNLPNFAQFEFSLVFDLN